jgi:hypothetical protein
VQKCGIAGQATCDSIIRRMRIECWIPKPTNTYSEYVILSAFLLQQWLHERAPVLLCIYVACLVSYSTLTYIESWGQGESAGPHRGRHVAEG